MTGVVGVTDVVGWWRKHLSIAQRIVLMRGEDKNIKNTRKEIT